MPNREITGSMVWFLPSRRRSPISYLLGGCCMDHTSAKIPRGQSNIVTGMPRDHPASIPGGRRPSLCSPTCARAVDKKKTQGLYTSKNYILPLRIFQHTGGLLAPTSWHSTYDHPRVKKSRITRILIKSKRFFFY